MRIYGNFENLSQQLVKHFRRIHRYYFFIKASFVQIDFQPLPNIEIFKGHCDKMIELQLRQKRITHLSDCIDIDALKVFMNIHFNLRFAEIDDRLNQNTGSGDDRLHIDMFNGRMGTLTGWAKNNRWNTSLG